MNTPTPQPPKILCSFHYWQNQDLQHLSNNIPTGTMIFGDSGAFSAASSGNPINLHQYTQWAQRWQNTLFCYPTLDVIGDPETTWQNQLRMKQDGLTPLPVYHFGSPLRHLRRYLHAGEKYIALGGMVGKAGKELKQWIIRCFKEAEPYGAVYHGFGRTRLEDLRDFPWYSVDSTSWNGPTRYRDFQIFDGHKLIHLQRSEPRSLYRHARLLRAHGVQPTDMDRRNPRSQDAGHTIGYMCWRRVEEWTRSRHGPIPGPRPGDPPGPHLFLAATGRDQTTAITTNHQHHPGPYLGTTR